MTLQVGPALASPDAPGRGLRQTTVLYTKLWELSCALPALCPMPT